MKRIFSLLGYSVFATAFLIGLFHTGLFSGLVFFYRGLVYIFLSSIFFLLLLIRNNQFSRSVFVSSVIVFFCMHTMFFTLIPVTLDRSISVFLLRYMAENQVSVSSQDLEKELTGTYIQKNHAIDKRMIEQLQTGSIVEHTDGFQITNKGLILVRLYEIIGAVFGINK